MQETLTRHEEAGTTDDPAYEAAVRVFYDRHLCRVPWPDCVQRSFAQMAADPTVYHTMNGPSEFHVHRLAEDVGHHRPAAARSRRRRCSSRAATTRRLRTSSSRSTSASPASQWELFEESSHMPHVEEPDAFLETVEAFLSRVDGADP